MNTPVKRAWGPEIALRTLTGQHNIPTRSVHFCNVLDLYVWVSQVQRRQKHSVSKHFLQYVALPPSCLSVLLAKEAWRGWSGCKVTTFSWVMEIILGIFCFLSVDFPFLTELSHLWKSRPWIFLKGVPFAQKVLPFGANGLTFIAFLFVSSPYR